MTINLELDQLTFCGGCAVSAQEVALQNNASTAARKVADRQGTQYTSNTEARYDLGMIDSSQVALAFNPPGPQFFFFAIAHVLHNAITTIRVCYYI